MPFDDAYYQDEGTLVGACMKNDRKAQRILYERYAPRMLALCMRYVGDRDAAQDVLQDGFVTVFGKMGGWSGEGSFEGWMRRVFVNQALMKLRKSDVLRDAADISDMKGHEPFQDNMLDHLQGEVIYGLIASMPAGFRTVFNLSVIEGFSHQEIASKLGISEGASRSQLSRARVWLQERITKLENRRR